MRNMIVTGIPRSGTTLAAAIIDDLPDTVCLNEPGWQTGLAADSARDFAGRIHKDFDAVRKKILEGTAIPDRRGADGKAVTNYYRKNEGGKMQETFRIMPFTRSSLSQHFTLAMKHNGPYLAVLPELVALERFSIIALVRHPVPVIHSWRSLDLPISRGEMPNAMRYWPALHAIISSPDELLIKQVKIYDLMCQRLYALRDSVHILSYESMVKEPQKLAAFAGAPEAIPAPLIGKPSRSVPPEEQRLIAAALEKHGTHFRQFYPELG